MRRRGFVVCLDARPETIAARIADTRYARLRPAAAGRRQSAGDASSSSRRSAQPLYAQADFIIQTDDLTPDQVTHQVLLAFRERSAVAGGAA